MAVQLRYRGSRYYISSEAIEKDNLNDSFQFLSRPYQAKTAKTVKTINLQPDAMLKFRGIPYEV